MSESDKPEAGFPRKRSDADRPAAPVRRRLLHGGLAAGPVVMTLVSRPVLGVAVCVTPSAFTSGNASVVGGVLCEGHTANYWIDAPNWPPPYTPDTSFTDVFGQNPDYTCMTLHDVLTLPDTGTVDPSPPSPGRPHRPRGSGSHDAGAQEPAPFQHRSLALGPPVDLGPRNPTLNYDPFNQQRASGAGASNNNDSHGRGRKHKPPEPAPPDPAPPEPSTQDPLACNDNSAPSTPPPSDPGSPQHRRGRNRGAHPNRTPRQADYLARDIVASLLNAQAGLTPSVPVATVKGIWREYATKGYFEPTAGVQWGLQDIQTYIASIQPA